MNIETAAEGVETEIQARDLLEFGCDIGQGFLFSRPIPADRISILLALGANRDRSSLARKSA